MRKLAAILLAYGLAACQTLSGEAPVNYSLSDEQAFALAKRAVTDSLKDPGSAQFGPTWERKKNRWALVGPPIEYVCGRVNAKNSYGAYTGMSQFVYRLDTGKIIMNGEDPDPAFRYAASLWC